MYKLQAAKGEGTNSVRVFFTREFQNQRPGLCYKVKTFYLIFQNSLQWMKP
jgi:hypothetical protein